MTINGPASINMSEGRGQTATLEHYVSGGRSRWSLMISSSDPLMDGYDEVSMRLDDESIQRLIEFLRTGLDPKRGSDLPDLPDWTLSDQRPEPRRLSID